MTAAGDEVTEAAFGGQLSHLAERLASMLDAALDKPDVTADELRILLQDVATGIEELRVAEEELVVQAEQLAASHREIDAERERYGQLFEFAPDGYVETDELGKILEANTAASRILGVGPRFLTGKLVHSFIAEHERRYVRTTVAELRASDEPVTIEVDVKPRGGEPVPVEMRVSVSADVLTGGPRVRWLLRDISEGLKLDRELHQLHAEVDLLAATARLTRLLEEEDRTEATLHALVMLAADRTGTEAGITLFGVEREGTVQATSGPIAAELCELQLEHGGPGVDTLKTGRGEVHDVEELEAWPELGAAARRRGVEWSISQPLPGGAPQGGFLNLYGTGPSEAAARAAELLAVQVANIIGNQQLYLSARDVAHHLQIALESRGVIEQAKGILMAAQGCGPDEAFDLLRRASQRENRKLRAMAEELVQRAATRRPDRPS